MWRIEFTSDRFLPQLPEPCQTNPGAYGFELAWWLSQQLLARGLVSSYPQSEDWGWFIEYTDEHETEIQIGCASVCSDGDGYKGAPIRWSVFVKRYRSLRERFGGRDRSEATRAVEAGVLNALQAAGIAPEQAEE